jgi:hypothetical protein
MCEWSSWYMCEWGRWWRLVHVRGGGGGYISLTATILWRFLVIGLVPLVTTNKGGGGESTLPVPASTTTSTRTCTSLQAWARGQNLSFSECRSSVATDLFTSPSVRKCVVWVWGGGQRGVCVWMQVFTLHVHTKQCSQHVYTTCAHRRVCR